MPHPLQVYNSSHEELFVYIKIYDVIEEKVVVICSRLRERNKKDKEIMLETTRNLKKKLGKINLTYLKRFSCLLINLFCSKIKT